MQNIPEAFRGHDLTGWIVVHDTDGNGLDRIMRLTGDGSLVSVFTDMDFLIDCGFTESEELLDGRNRLSKLLDLDKTISACYGGWAPAPIGYEQSKITPAGGNHPCCRCPGDRLPGPDCHSAGPVLWDGADGEGVAVVSKRQEVNLMAATITAGMIARDPSQCDTRYALALAREICSMNDDGQICHMNQIQLAADEAAAELIALRSLVKELAEGLGKASHAMRHPLDDWKGTVERDALAQAATLIARAQEAIK